MFNRIECQTVNYWIEGQLNGVNIPCNILSWSSDLSYWLNKLVVNLKYSFVKSQLVASCQQDVGKSTQCMHLTFCKQNWWGQFKNNQLILTVDEYYCDAVHMQCVLVLSPSLYAVCIGTFSQSGYCYAGIPFSF